jgi:DNA repair photolyase
MTEERKTGTREWAETNLNIADGCSHGCRYCYARQAAVVRFAKRSGKTFENWTDVVVDPKRVNKQYGKRTGTIMFPTTHDIVPEIIDDCVTVLTRVLSVGNNVLIVSKPHTSCVVDLCTKLLPWRDQVLYRFTIGADDDEILKLWEPNAPSFAERLECLRFAHGDRWRTSVSIEPMLDPANIDRLVTQLAPFVSDTLWIGKMNHIRARCSDMDDAVLTVLEAEFTDEKILAMVERLGGNPKIRWKDSVKLVIEQKEIREACGSPTEDTP